MPEPKHQPQPPQQGTPKSQLPKHRLGGGRIQRRLPEQMAQEGMTEEAARGRQAGQKILFWRRGPKGNNPPTSKKNKWVRRIVVGTFSLLLVGVLSIGIFLAYTLRNDDLWLNLDQVAYRTETILYYTDPITGQTGEYTRLPSTQDKIYTPGEEIPPQLGQAFVAVEDRGFYQHGGVDIKRTAFALLNEAKYAVTGSYLGGEAGQKQGASTITQQLVKNLTRDEENTSMAGYLRKIKEIARAVLLEGKYDKQAILTAYVNTISFTGNTAGVGAEAQKLFGKPPAELSLAQCASLAAITRNPARYNPRTNEEAHITRRNYILSQMCDQGYITPQQRDEAVVEAIQLASLRQAPRPMEITSYFTDGLMEEVLQDLTQQRGISRQQASDLLYNGGLRIYTTVHPVLQKSMEQVLEQASLYPRPSHMVQVLQRDEQGNPLLNEQGAQVFAAEKVLAQGAMISLGYDGSVCGVVGGLGEKEISRGFNRATSGVRQVGSTMKAIGPYAVALENNKITWSTPFLDAPVGKETDPITGEEAEWPANVNLIYTEKDVLVRDAFARSVNTVAVRVGQTVGNNKMYNFLHGTLGIETLTRQDRAPGPLVLGSSTYGITPLEMAKSYAMFGNGGKVPQPHFYTRIQNGVGQVLLAKEAQPKQAIGEDTAFIMNHLLQEVLKSGGTAAGMRVPGELESAGKTGTTSDNRDHWFIGLTPYYVTASWYGFDDNTSIQVNSRQHPPTLAWREVMRKAQQGLPYVEFPATEGVVELEYCALSGSLAGPGCPKATGYYKEGALPPDRCPLHGGAA